MSPEPESSCMPRASRSEYRGTDDLLKSRPLKHDSPSSSDRQRTRDRSRDRKRRRRSESPDSPKRRRSHSRDSERRRNRDRDRGRDRDRVDRERRSPGSHSGRPRRNRNGDYDDKPKDRSRRRSPDEKPPRRRRNEDEPTTDSRGKELVKNDKPPVRQRGPLPSQEASFAVEKGEEPEKPVEKANFGTTGRLAAASNSVTKADGTTVALKYHEPAEARKPSPRDQYKLFVFKGPDIVDEIVLNLRSCWLIGRDKAIVDYPAEHPSISKQHAVIQFRYVEKRNEFGDKIGKVKPYLLDLQSANGTALNGEEIADSRYYELRNKDMIQFGDSTREYVLMLARA